jgi:hypothetical protein
MKRSLLAYLSLIITCLFLDSCKTNVTYSGLRPADISLPSDIKNVVLVNRYKAEKGNSWLNVVEGIFSGEVAFADRRGVDQALSGLQQRLQSGPKYNVVIANEQLVGNGLGMFPPALDKNQVQQLCSINNADALIAIEAFDSDIAIATRPRERKSKVNGVEVIEKFFAATETVRITIGWRIYLAETGTIIDQHQMLNTRIFSAEGPTIPAARAALLFPVDAIMQTGLSGGDTYGIRIAPSWVTYSRMIYSRASRSKKMKQARRMAIRGDWVQAGEIWENMSKSPNIKVAKRSMYNRAVAAEMAGQFDDALNWARKAADTYNLRTADAYIYTLNRRLEELQRLDEQMKEE